MKRLYLLLSLCLWPVLATAQSSADPLQGRWRPQDEPEAVIELVQVQGAYQGHLVAHAKHPKRVGLHVLRDLRWQPQERRWRGQVYAVKRDRLLEADLVPEGSDRFTLVVKTLLGTRAVTWERVP